MDRLQEIKDRLAAATPGPWRWDGDLDYNDVRLSTVGLGRLVVMGFRRWGMRGAAPEFWVRKPDAPRGHGGRLVRLPECAVRERPYRGQIATIDNPDAQLIEHAPELLAWAVEEIERRDAVIEAARNLIRALDAPPDVQEEHHQTLHRLNRAFWDASDALDEQPVKEAV